MNLQDNCSVCQTSMLRKAVVRCIPCLHLIHKNCLQPILSNHVASCPLCREDVEETEDIERKLYAKTAEKDRRLIVEAANRGEDWRGLSEKLGVNSKTAYTWVRSGQPSPNTRGGHKPKKLDDEEIEQLLSLVESNPSVTLRSLQSHVLSNFHKAVSTTTIGNVLQGRLFSVKMVHHQSVTMNTIQNKERRRAYVSTLNNYIRDGKQVVWVDETNFNLFVRRRVGWSKVGHRTVVPLPSSRGPNIHLIGGIASSGIIKMNTRRGSFRWENVNEWMQGLLEQWTSNGFLLRDLVVVVDNAPSHSRLSEVFQDNEAVLLRLGPYSPMLNPIETIWAKVKAHVKTQIRVPQVTGPQMQEQRLSYLEGLITNSIPTITPADCARSIQHATAFHEAALNMDDMNVGQ